MLSIKVSTLLHYSHMTITWQSQQSCASYNSHDRLRSDKSHRSHTSHTNCDKAVTFRHSYESHDNHTHNAPYVILHVTECEKDRWRKCGYYAAILSGEENNSLWSASTAKQFVSSLLHWCMQVSLIALVSISPVETLGILGGNVKSLPALVRKELTNCSTVLTLHRPLKIAA